MSGRAETLAELARVVLAEVRPHPVRVAVDGCSAAGKTTLADEVAGVLGGRTTRAIIRVGIDYFKRAVELRTAYPPDSPDSYYLDSWDNAAIRDRLLVPLGPGGDRRYCRPSWTCPPAPLSTVRFTSPPTTPCCSPTARSCSGAVVMSGSASATVTVFGTVQNGVEGGCLVLVTTYGAQYTLLGGDRIVLRPGVRVLVSGTIPTGVVTVCMQGYPLQVSSATLF